MSSEFVKTISAQIREMALSNQWDLLPPLRSLANYLNVSTSVVFQSCSLLKAEGFLEETSNRRLRIKGSSFKPLPSISSRDELYRELKEKIKDGSFPVGTALPKFDFFQKEKRISNHTVSEVYRRLESEGWIYRKGKKWISGNVEEIKNPAASNFVIVILMKKIDDWGELFRSSRTGPFCYRFTEEAERQQIRLILVATSNPPSPENTGIVSRRDFQKFLNSLGIQYLGCLSILPSYDNPEDANWVLDCANKGSVAIFDKNNSIKIPGILRKKSVRFFFSEHNGLKLVIRSAQESGHQSAVYWSPYENAWSINRGNELKRLCEKNSFQFKILPSAGQTMRNINKDFLEEGLNWILENDLPAADAIETYLKLVKDLRKEERHKDLFRWNRSTPRLEKISNLLRYIAWRGESFSRLENKNYANILLRLPLLLTALSDPDLRLIICANDFEANKLVITLQSLELKLPRNLSLISFDGQRFEQPLAPSTIDFGFGYLGYTAFHFLRGDVPNVIPQGKDVSSKPRLINRGTLLPPQNSIPVNVPLVGKKPF